MKNSQNQKISRIQKDDVNSKSPTLFILLGLVLALLVSYMAIEFKTFVDPTKTTADTTVNPFDDEFIPEIPLKEDIPIKKQREIDLNKFDVVDNNRDINEPIIKPQDPDGPVITPKINLDSIKAGKEIEPEVYDIISVSEAPVFPGCSGTNEELKKCFSEKIQKFVGEKFDTTLAEGLELSGKQRIVVQFIVDNSGNITDVKVRAPHKRLENEAVRVVNLLPQMIPGKQQFKPVKVKYTLPIVFEIQ